MKTKSNLHRAANAVDRVDSSLVRTAVRYSDAAPVRWVGTFSKIGDQPELRTLSALTLFGGVMAGKPRLIRAGLRMFIAHELATALKDLIKTRVDRTRPRSADSRRQRALKPGNGKGKEVSSFPSGHSAGSIAVARAYSREFPQHSVPALLTAGVVAGAQVPRNAHYATDVAAGLLVGATAEILSNAAWSLAASAIAPDDDRNDADPLPERAAAAS